MTRQSRRGGCFKMFNMFWTIVFFFVALLLTGFNLFFSNIFGETCGIIHPYIFNVEVSVIDANGLMLTSDEPVPFANNPTIIEYQARRLLETASGEPLDTYLRIYDSDGSLLTANDDTPIGLNSAINSFSLANDQEIIIEVGTYNDSAEGQYNLYIQDNGIVPNTIEFGGEIVEGGQLNSDQLDSGILLEDDIGIGQRVQYTVAVSGAKNYYIALNSPVESLDTYLRVYDINGILLASNDDSPNGGLNSELDAFSVARDQEVIIEVGTYRDSVEGQFNLYIQENSTVLDTIGFDGTIIDGGQFDSTQLEQGEYVTGDILSEQRLRYRASVIGGHLYFIALNGSQGFQNTELIATNWASCLQYYGFVDNDGYVINTNGYRCFVPQNLANKAF